jgi:chaperonin cofactor prefoldin
MTIRLKERRRIKDSNTDEFVFEVPVQKTEEMVLKKEDIDTKIARLQEQETTYQEQLGKIRGQIRDYKNMLDLIDK